jgi:hypothetical protein
MLREQDRGSPLGKILAKRLLGQSHPKVMKNGSCSATTVPGSTTSLPFVISERSNGEICVPFLETFFATERRTAGHAEPRWLEGGLEGVEAALQLELLVSFFAGFEQGCAGSCGLVTA